VACDDNARLLHGYLDGELDLVTSLGIEEHLKSCADCAQELRSQQTLSKAFRASSLYERAPKSLEASIRASLSAEANKASGNQNVVTISSGRRAFVNWLAVAAAIMFAVLLSWRVLPTFRDRTESNLIAQEVIDSHIRSLQPNHLTDVESNDQHNVKPWFNGKLDFSPPVRDLSAEGFPLVGGRMDYVNRRDVAALVYQRRKHVINVFVWPDAPGSVEPPHEKSVQGYNMIFSGHNGMYFCAVSDLSTAELRDFSQLLEH
jgi:anti-sigma factor RsiW